MNNFNDLFDDVDKHLQTVINDLEDLERKNKKLRTWNITTLLCGMIIGFALALIFISDAESDELNIHVSSWHSQDRDFYNYKNTGLGYSYDYTDFLQIKVGFYKNSFYKTSVYLGGNYHQENCNFCLGVFVGGVTGYSNIVSQQAPAATRNLNEFQFIVLPSLTIRESKHHSITLGYMPSFVKGSISFATFTYNYTF